MIWLSNRLQVAGTLVVSDDAVFADHRKSALANVRPGVDPREFFERGRAARL